MKLRRTQRRGSTLVESAFVYPVLFLIMMALVLLGLGVFRYHQIAHAAREGARWASVHGAKYGSATQNIQYGTVTIYSGGTGNNAATAADIYANAIQPQLVGLPASDITYSVSWNTSNSQYHTTTTAPTTAYPQGQVVNVANTVSVTVTYRYNPGLFFGAVNLTSTSVATMQY